MELSVVIRRLTKYTKFMLVLLVSWIVWYHIMIVQAAHCIISFHTILIETSIWCVASLSFFHLSNKSAASPPFLMRILHSGSLLIESRLINRINVIPHSITSQVLQWNHLLEYFGPLIRIPGSHQIRWMQREIFDCVLYLAANVWQYDSCISTSIPSTNARMIDFKAFEVRGFFLNPFSHRTASMKGAWDLMTILQSMEAND